MSKHDDYKIQLTLDYDDIDVIGDDVKEKISSYGEKVFAMWGQSENKIHAVNRDMEFSGEWNILICMSDDMVWVQEGFDIQIIKDMHHYFPDGDGFLHYPDGAVNQKLATMSIMGKKYYDRFEYIYNPEYESVYCDQEAMQVAKKLGKYQYINNHLFEHKHPRWKKSEWDEQYRRTEDPSVYARDRRTFMRRQANNFYI